MDNDVIITAPKKKPKAAQTAQDDVTIAPNQAIAPIALIIALGVLAVLIPVLEVYLYFLAGVVVALLVVAYTNRAARYRLKRLMGSHEGQAKIILAANETAVLNIDLSYPNFQHWDCVYVIDKTAVRDEGGIPSLYYYQSVPEPIKFPNIDVIYSGEKIMAAQKTHWTIARMIAANELWDLFKLILICVIVAVLVGLLSAYLSYDTGQKAVTGTAYCEYVMNRTLELANTTIQNVTANAYPIIK